VGSARSRSIAAAGAAALLAAGPGCAATSARSGPGTSVELLTPARSGTVAISARDNSFVADKVTVTVGSKLVWRNDGRNEHNIVGVGDTPFHVDTAAFGPKATYEYTAAQPGTYHYYCSIHGTSDKGMPGTVQVVPN
jgi:plastocyanin